MINGDISITNRTNKAEGIYKWLKKIVKLEGSFMIKPSQKQRALRRFYLYRDWKELINSL
jgi:hypothetical protein